MDGRRENSKNPCLEKVNSPCFVVVFEYKSEEREGEGLSINCPIAGKKGNQVRELEGEMEGKVVVLSLLLDSFDFRFVFPFDLSLPTPEVLLNFCYLYSYKQSE